MFGALDARQLNWRPDATRWSVGQCFEHLLLANRLMFQAAKDALNDTAPRTILAALAGSTWRPGSDVDSLAGTEHDATVHRIVHEAQPATSDIAADIIQRFVEQHRDAVARVRALDERDAARTIMTSPFI